MKNVNLIFVLTATASVCLPGMTTGYELSTHAGMTNVTYDKSILSVSSTYARLGLTTRTQKRLGEIYFDLADALPQPISVRPRTHVQYELDNLPGKFTFPDDEVFGVRAWMMRGSIREDDTSTTLSVLKTGSPRDDPDGNINRFCNHFFDPVNVQGINRVRHHLSPASSADLAPLVPPAARPTVQSLP